MYQYTVLHCFICSWSKLICFSIFKIICNIYLNNQHSVVVCTNTIMMCSIVEWHHTIGGNIMDYFLHYFYVFFSLPPSHASCLSALGILMSLIHSGCMCNLCMLYVVYVIYACDISFMVSHLSMCRLMICIWVLLIMANHQFMWFYGQALSVYLYRHAHISI